MSLTDTVSMQECCFDKPAPVKVQTRTISSQTAPLPVVLDDCDREHSIRIKYLENEMALLRQERHAAVQANERLQTKYDKLLHASTEAQESYQDQIHEMHSYMLLSGTRDSLYSGSVTVNLMDMNRALALELSAEIQLLNHKVQPLRRTCVQVMDRYAKEVADTEAMRRDLMQKMEKASIDFNNELRVSVGTVNAIRQWLISKNIELPSIVKETTAADVSSTTADKRTVGHKTRHSSSRCRDSLMIQPSSDYEDADTI